MKHLLFPVIFLLGVNCIAQNNKLVSRAYSSTHSPLVSGIKHYANENFASGKPGFTRKENLATKDLLLKQKLQTQLFDSVYMWRWDTTSTDWALDYKYSVKEYDANNNVLTDWAESWDGTSWVISDKTDYTYDENNNELSYKWFFWSGTDWENYQKGSYVYDANNNILTELVQDGDGSNWVNSMLMTKTYDANNNLTSYLHQNWNGTDWENYWREIYTYDVKNNMTSSLHQVWSVEQWEDNGQNTYSYDADNRLIKAITQVDNGAELVTSETTHFYNTDNKPERDSTHTSGNSWERDYQVLYTYDSNGNLASTLYQSYNSGIPEDINRTLYTYDNSNNETSQFSQDWKDNSWVNWDLERQTFDENDTLTNYSYRYWDASGTVIMDGDSSAYYYHTVNTGLKENDISKGNITVYPNPSDGIFNIESNNTVKSLEIYDSFGKLTYSESGYKQQFGKEINLSNYGNGVYLIKLQTSKGIVCKKILIR